jgi:hypothetical protein
VLIKGKAYEYGSGVSFFLNIYPLTSFKLLKGSPFHFSEAGFSEESAH